ncbi:MAG: methionine gamma-lyase family protein [bacterium]|nr:methionine gamma-lyase family protein [bacterium]
MLKINKDVYKLCDEAENNLKSIYSKIDNISFFNSKKVLNAFIENNISESDFVSSTGYGYNDFGRDKIEKVYATIFKSEDALVRNQFISGSHALTITLFALLRPNDTLLSITGKPYDTLDEVIGIKENDSSLKSFNINYEQIELKNNDFDYEKIKEVISSKYYKVIEIQRSKGYSTRKSLSIEKLEKVIKEIRKYSPNSIVMVDNCYCEFVSEKEPIEIGADIAVGSLIKNLGGGIASNGAYIVGKAKLIKLCAERLNLPGEGKDVGPSLGANKFILQGLYFAPNVVSNAVKVAILTSYLLEKIGYDVEPKFNEERVDIVQSIIFNNEKDLINYARIIQNSSAIDSNAFIEKTDMPGYSDKIIMASGNFTQGSSIELSCDGPIRNPYILYQQGSLTYDYGKIAVLNAISFLLNNK